MLRVVGCIVDQHNLWLVLLAGLICAIASFTCFSLMVRMRASSGRLRFAWLAAGAFVTGSGVWATHFVAELAFRPGLAVGYGVTLTIASALAGITISGCGLYLLMEKRLAPLAGGIVGLGVVVLHYIGMAALRLPADARWDGNYVTASVIISVFGAAASFAIAARWQNPKGRLAAALTLVLSVVGLHFTAMTAVTFIPNPAIMVDDTQISPALLAIAIAATSFLIVGLGLVGAAVDQRLALQAIAEAARLRDYVTALEEKTQQLTQALAAASAADRAKSSFLATMSHELRTPLNAILGFTEVMKMEMLGPVGNAQYRDYHEQIFRSGHHLLKLINDILDLSKLESGYMELFDENIELRPLLADCLKLVGPQAEKDVVYLHFSSAVDRPAMRGDEKRLRQVFLNILSNAVKFTPPGGNVCVIISSREGGLEVAVSDTGIGMSADEIPRALERFGQIDNRLSRKYEGTGLGLPLAKHLIELHGGTLTIESAVALGTTVRVHLPKNRVLRAAPYLLRA